MRSSGNGRNGLNGRAVAVGHGGPDAPMRVRTDGERDVCEAVLRRRTRLSEAEWMAWEDYKAHDALIAKAGDAATALELMAAATRARQAADKAALRSARLRLALMAALAGKWGRVSEDERRVEI